MTANRAVIINRTADITMTTTANSRATKTNTTTISTTIRVAPRMAMHTTLRVVNPDVVSTTQRKTLRRSATSP